MNKIRVILISSVKPEPSSAGQVVLYRHLVDRPEIELEVYGQEPQRPSVSTFLRRLFGWLGSRGWPWRRWVNGIWVLWAGRWMDADLPSTVKDRDRTVVLTVAHGDGFQAAGRFARKHQLPLVVFFQDWFPDIEELPAVVRPLLERKFLSLAKDCFTGLCVCEGMREHLGSMPNLAVLRNIPEETRTISAFEAAPGTEREFRVLYFGNLGEYGPMVGEALQAVEDVPGLKLEVRGSNPKWPEQLKERARASGVWLPFAPRSELDRWLASADAFLVPMVFDPQMRRRMETSFPSKLGDCAQFGKPLVVWGPEYCSAIQWGRRDDRALCVTDPDPVALVLALERLAASAGEQTRLSAAAERAAREELNPFLLQAQFREALEQALVFRDAAGKAADKMV